MKAPAQIGRAATAKRAFADHQVELVRLAFLLSGSRPHAEDAVAEVFARAWKALEAGSIEDPASYLRRAVINEVRRQRRRRVLEQTRQLVRPSSDGGFERALVERDRVLGALAGMSTRQREVLVLRFWEDRSVLETARILGITTGAVKTHTHRGLGQLRARLEES